MLPVLLDVLPLVEEKKETSLKTLMWYSFESLIETRESLFSRDKHVLIALPL